MYFHTYSLLCTHVALQAPFNSFLLVCREMNFLIGHFFSLFWKKSDIFISSSFSGPQQYYPHWFRLQEGIYLLGRLNQAERPKNQQNASQWERPEGTERSRQCGRVPYGSLSLYASFVALQIVIIVYYSLLYYYCWYVTHFNHQHIFWWGKTSLLHKCLIFYYSADGRPLSLSIVNMIDFLYGGSTSCLLSRNETRRSQISLTSLAIQ